MKKTTSSSAYLTLIKDSFNSLSGSLGKLEHLLRSAPRSQLSKNRIVALLIILIIILIIIIIIREAVMREKCSFF